MTIPLNFHERFEQAAIARVHCRIVYQDDLGEHHAVMAIPRCVKKTNDTEVGFFTSDSGEILEIMLEDIVAIELPKG